MRSTQKQHEAGGFHHVTRGVILAMSIAALAAFLTGCSASPRPMTVLMPTYAFDRDVMGDNDIDAQPMRMGAVASVEP